jgi:uncharacterized protein (DUF2141 family)
MWSSQLGGFGKNRKVYGPMRLKALVLIVVLEIPHSPQGTSNALRSTVPHHSGTISGTVLLHGQERAPVRNAAVILSSLDPVLTLTCITDDGGHFVFTGLPAARYSIDVTKTAYLPGRYGANRPGQPGGQLALTDGESASFVEVLLFPGAVIDGTVRDSRGGLVGAARVSASRYHVTADGAVPTFAQTVTTVADDVGHFRFFGLPPGNYAVTAFPSDVEVSNRVRRLQPGEVKRAVDSATHSAGAVSIGRPQTVAPVVTERLVPVSVFGLLLRLGDEIHDLHIRLGRGMPVTVAGKVTNADGSPAASVRVTVRPIQNSGVPPASQNSAVTNEQGLYTISTLVPGVYSVQAYSRQSNEWASTTATIGAGIWDVPLSLRPGGTVSGRIAFDGIVSRVKVPDLILGLRLVSVTGEATNPPALTSAADGTFEFAQVAPGLYRLVFSQVRDHGWFMTGAGNARGSFLDPPFVSIGSADEVREVVVTFTDHPTEVRGTMFDAVGRPTSAYSVVVFPAEPMLWHSGSFRVKETVVASNGSYSIKGLPAGNYLLAARTIDWPSSLIPAVLSEFVPFGIPITIRARETVVQDLMLRSAVADSSAVKLSRLAAK